MKKKDKYSEKDIQQFEWHESVRKRPGMYLDTLNTNGLIKLWKGILSELVGSCQADSVLIELKGKNRGKFVFYNFKKPLNDDFSFDYQKAYNFNHGLNIAIFYAVSESFVFRIFKDEKLLSEQCFEKGILKKGKSHKKDFFVDRLELEFELDEEIWNEDFEWNENYITNEIRNYAYLHRRVKFELNYKVEGEECKVIFKFKNGLQDRLNIEKLNGLGSCFFDTWFEEKIGDFTVECAFAFRDYSVDESFLKPYANDFYTHENGTHVDGLLKGLTYGVMKYFQKNDLTEAYKISEKGMRQGLIAAINVKLDAPVFSGCVKNKLANPEIIEPISDYVSELLFKKIEADEIGTKKLIRKFEIYNP